MHRANNKKNKQRTMDDGRVSRRLQQRRHAPAFDF